MSVDKIIEALEQNRGSDTYSNYNEDVLDALIAALKAGQRMREMLSDGWNACRDWDAATQSEEDV